MNLAAAEGIAAALDRLDGSPDLRVGVLAGAGKRQVEISPRTRARGG